MPPSIIFLPEHGQQDEPHRPAANTAVRAKRRRPPRQQQKQKQQQQQPEQIEDEEQTTAPAPAPAPVLAASPASRAIAPYSANTAAEDRKLQFLIHHYCTIVVDETVTSVGPRYEWFPFSLRNPSFFHAVMASTSSHAAYLKRDDLPRDFFFHKGEAIRLVNAQIGAGAHDEGTINTVAIFSQQESFEGRTDPTRMHITGLLHLVQAAGGLESPTLSPKTRRLVAQTDQAACIVLNSQHFISTSRPGSLEQYFGPPSAVTAERTNAFRNRLINFSNDIVDPGQVEVVVDLCDKAGNVFWGLRNLTVSLQAIHDGKEVVDTPSEQDLQFSDRIEVLERIVHDLWYQQEYLVFRLFGWTCLIYIYTILRELPYQLGINNVLAGRIKNALEKLEKRADLNVLLGTFQDFFLWQMFLCGKVADTRDKGWFAKQAARILITRRIETEPEVVAAADAFLWPEKDDVLGSPDSIDDSSEYAASKSPPSEVVASLRGPGPGLPIREKSAEIKSE